jgi:hypothetical protein
MPRCIYPRLSLRLTLSDVAKRSRFHTAGKKVLEKAYGEQELALIQERLDLLNGWHDDAKKGGLRHHLPAGKRHATHRNQRGSRLDTRAKVCPYIFLDLAGRSLCEYSSAKEVVE